MKKFSRICLKKVRNRKNKNLSNKSVVLGNKSLVGRYYDGGSARYISFNSVKLGRLLQFHNLEVTNKVGWLLVQVYFLKSTRKIPQTIDNKFNVASSKQKSYKKIYNVR